MTWKNILRKAPFNIGDAQITRLEQMNADKKKALVAFINDLEDFLDDELQEKIRHNPNAESYTIHVKEITEAIKNLHNLGIENSDIIQLLKKEYNAQRVEIHTDGSIKFDGVITL
jgi:CRISPR/Cas system CSM-associated protein Csm4 (group 5 of RAMP superfamily)